MIVKWIKNVMMDFYLEMLSMLVIQFTILGTEMAYSFTHNPFSFMTIEAVILFLSFKITCKVIDKQNQLRPESENISNTSPEISLITETHSHIDNNNKTELPMNIIMRDKVKQK